MVVLSIYSFTQQGMDGTGVPVYPVFVSRFGDRTRKRATSAAGAAGEVQESNTTKDGEYGA